MADKSAHKAKTRARILDEAARAIRIAGTQGVSVADLMKRAGLTHGGFYAHFDSRDDLVAHAVTRMFEDSAAMLDRTLGEEPDGAGLRKMIEYYLSENAYRRVESGCPLPGLLGEVGRMPAAARERFEQGIWMFRERIRQALVAMGVPESDDMANSLLAELVGTMTLARSLTDDHAALALLHASRERLLERVPSV